MEKLREIILNPIALRKAKIVFNFGLSECNRAELFMLPFHIWSTVILSADTSAPDKKE